MNKQNRNSYWQKNQNLIYLTFKSRLKITSQFLLHASSQLNKTFSLIYLYHLRFTDHLLLEYSLDIRILLIIIKLMALISLKYVLKCNYIQTFYYFLTSGGLKDKCMIDDVELLSLITAGACHDHEHPGFTNAYLSEALDPLALRYNGIN